MDDPELPIHNIQSPLIPIVSKKYANVSESLYPLFEPYSKMKINYGDITKYKISYSIGSGKFSTVFCGTDGKKVFAMKIFKEIRQNCIKREIFIHLALKKCPLLVRLHDILKDPVSKCTILVLKYHKSKDWKEYFPKMNLHDTKLYMYNLLSALEECHSHGIMHRDVKQHNILYDPKTKEFHLGDFGLAEVYFPNHQYEVGVGTSRFMAPELLISYRYYSYAVDIWSAAVVLAEILFGSPFFKGEYPLDILRSITKIFTSSPVLVFAEKVNLNVMGYLLDNLSSISLPTFEECFKRVKPSMRDPQLFDLIRRMFVIDPSMRITASDALNHPVFDDIKAELKATKNEK